MNDTIKIEMEMPRPPEGFRYKGVETGEAVCRLPKKGEWYLDSEGTVIKAALDFETSKYPILERVPWEPKVGEKVWQTNPAGDVCNSTFCSSPSWWLKFRVSEDAEKFYREARALADRIRAESEG